MDKQKAKQIGVDLQEAVSSVARAHGVTAQVRGGVFDPSGLLTVRVEFKEAEADRLLFERFATQHGLQKEDFGRSYESGGRRFTICGYNYKASKNPILLRDSNGTIFTTTAEAARMHLGSTVKLTLTDNLLGGQR